jgi:hypothetical protein
MSRIGVARVEKRQELDGASLYTVHDFYALTGMDKARNELSQVFSLLLFFFLSSHRPSKTGTLRQQFDRCISAIQVALFRFVVISNVLSGCLDEQDK